MYLNNKYGEKFKEEVKAVEDEKDVYKRQAFSVSQWPAFADGSTKDAHGGSFTAEDFNLIPFSPIMPCKFCFYGITDTLYEYLFLNSI